MDANKFDVKKLTIKEVLQIKSILGLTDGEAISIFFRGDNDENI